MCGSALRFRQGDYDDGLRPKTGHSPEFSSILLGRPKAFRTSDGKAAAMSWF